MAKFELREKAISLRKEGYTYGEIKLLLNVAKGTLCTWLQAYPLSNEQIDRVKKERYKRIEKYRQTMLNKRKARMDVIYEAERKDIGLLSPREFYILGLGLFWGEGSKTKSGSLEITNTDPVMLRFFKKWCEMGMNVLPSALRVSLHLYSDMCVEEESKYWSRELGIPLSQFHRPYIKKSNLTRVNHKGGFGHGTCRIAVYKTQLVSKVLMGIKTISSEFERP